MVLYLISLLLLLLLLSVLLLLLLLLCAMLEKQFRAVCMPGKSSATGYIHNLSYCYFFLLYVFETGYL